MTPLLSVHDLIVRRRGAEVLKNISFEVVAGEIIVLMGASGAGKSTLLRAICGLQRTRAGSICIGGTNVTSLPPHKRSTAMVMDEAGLFHHMNVEDNIRFAVNTELNDTVPEDQVQAAMISMNIRHLRGRYPSQLSTGQRQKVALARVLVRRPRVLLFDEPLAHVDTMASAQLKEEIVRVHNRTGAATVYVTHDVKEAFSIADRIIYLERGKIIQDDFPQDVHDAPASLAIARHLGATTVVPAAASITQTKAGITKANTHVLGQDLRVAASPELDSRVGQVTNVVLVGYEDAVKICSTRPTSSRFVVGENHGQVIATTYQGETYASDVETEVGTLKAVNPADSAGFVPGDCVEIELDENRLWALPSAR